MEWQYEMNPVFFSDGIFLNGNCHLSVTQQVCGYDMSQIPEPNEPVNHLLYRLVLFVCSSSSSLLENRYMPFDNVRSWLRR